MYATGNLAILRILRLQYDSTDSEIFTGIGDTLICVSVCVYTTNIVCLSYFVECPLMSQLFKQISDPS